jgi:hypothetical protein
MSISKSPKAYFFSGSRGAIFVESTTLVPSVAVVVAEGVAGKGREPSAMSSNHTSRTEIEIVNRKKKMKKLLPPTQRRVRMEEAMELSSRNAYLGQVLQAHFPGAQAHFPSSPPQEQVVLSLPETFLASALGQDLQAQCPEAHLQVERSPPQSHVVLSFPASLVSDLAQSPQAHSPGAHGHFS